MRINFRYFIFSHGLCRSTYLNIRWIIGSGTQKYHSRYLEHIFNLRHIWFPRVAATMEWEWYPCIKSIWDSMLSKRIPKMCKASNWCVCDIWHEPNSMHFFRLMFIYHILMVVAVCVYCVYNIHTVRKHMHIYDSQMCSIWYGIFSLSCTPKHWNNIKLQAHFWNLISFYEHSLFVCRAFNLSKKCSVCLKCMLYAHIL